MFEIKLGFQALLRNKKRTLTTTLIVSFLILFIILINTIPFTNRSTRDLEREMTYGSWSHTFSKDAPSDRYSTIGSIHKVTDTLGSFDQNMFDLARFSYYKGRAPKNSTEAIVTLDGLDAFGLDYELNTSFVVEGYDFEIVGIIYSYNHEWVSLEHFVYPTIITTGLEHENPQYFGLAHVLSKGYIVDDAVEINLFSYPYLELGTELQNDRDEAYRLMRQQYAKLTTLMLIAASCVLFMVFKSDGDFYKKRYRILSEQGVTQMGIARYWLPELCYFLLVVWVSYKGIPMLLNAILSIPKNLRFDMSYRNVNEAMHRTLFAVAFISITCFMSWRLTFKGHKYFNLIYTTITMGICFLIIYANTPQTITFFDERVPQWRELESLLQENRIYLADGSWGDFNEGAELSQFKGKWTDADFDDIRSHPKTEEFYRWNKTYVHSNDDAIDPVNYFDEQLLHKLNMASILSQNFYEGTSYYILSDDVSTLDIQEVLDLNGKHFEFEDVLPQPAMENEHGLRLTHGILISEQGARRIGLDTKHFNIFMVSVGEMSDYSKYDVLIKRHSKKSMLSNVRLNVERFVQTERAITVFMGIEILIQYTVGVAILGLIYLQKLMSQRKTIAIKHFLGVTKKNLIWQQSVAFVFPLTLTIVPAVMLASQSEISVKIRVLCIFSGIVFLLILWVACVIMNRQFFKENLFDLLDERE